VISPVGVNQDFEKTFTKIMAKAPKLSNTSTAPRHEKSRNSVLENAVSAKLKAYYSEMEHQDVPKTLLDLLDKLDKSVN
jgi:Anti-sigma factor NepR